MTTQKPIEKLRKTDNPFKRQKRPISTTLTKSDQNWLDSFNERFNDGKPVLASEVGQLLKIALHARKLIAWRNETTAAYLSLKSWINKLEELFVELKKLLEA